jgi:hypothetical protein
MDRPGTGTKSVEIDQRRYSVRQPIDCPARNQTSVAEPHEHPSRAGVGIELLDNLAYVRGQVSVRATLGGSVANAGQGRREDGVPSLAKNSGLGVPQPAAGAGSVNEQKVGHRPILAAR